jgi:hypothetical protein
MTTRIANILRVSLVGAAAVASLASGASPGERAGEPCYVFCEDRPDAGPNGNCPVGETCSDDTPSGLWFVGPSLGDEIFTSTSRKALARGGTQYITVARNSGGDPLTLDFDAMSDGPSLLITSAAPPRVTVTGGSPGTAYLRVLEPGTDLLYDRISFSTSAVSRVVAVPDGAYRAVDLFLEDAELDGIAVWLGATANVVLQLFNTNDTRLVDEEMTLAPSATWSRQAWDTLELQPSSAGAVSIGVDVGVDHFDLSIPVATSADAIVGVDGFGGGAPQPTQPMGSERSYCFRATAANRVILGAPFQFGTTSRLPIVSTEGNCVRVGATAVGSALLAVTVGNRSESFPIEVIPAAAAPPPRADDPAAVPATGGERALEF